MPATPRLLGLLAACACGGPSAGGPTEIANRGADPADEPSTDSTLALVEPRGSECALERVDPVAKTARELARLPGSCAGASLAWRGDARRALVWFRPGNLHAALVAGPQVASPAHPDDELEVHERRYEVDVATHAVTPIAPPAGDEIAAYGYGPDGALYAFAERDLPGTARGTRVTVEGVELDFTHLGEGSPAAAIAYRRDGSTWKLASVARTTTGWDYAAGWSASPLAPAIGPRSEALLAPYADTHDVEPAAQDELARIAPSHPDGDGWAELATAHGPLYVWMFNAEFTHTTGRIAWRDRGALVAPPGLDFTAGELVSVRARGRYLLVAGPNAGAYPRLYALVEHRCVFASETARAVTLWPVRTTGSDRS